MANKNYLCKCNNCGNIMYDENPNVNSIPIDVTTIEKPINHMVQLRDDGEFYLACPNCLTDSYLMDIIDNDF